MDVLVIGVQMTVRVNQGPSGGNCTASPTRGRALSTLVRLQCLEWVDGEGNYPLAYSYAAIRPSGRQIVLSSVLNVSVFQVSQSANSPLPDHTQVHAIVSHQAFSDKCCLPHRLCFRVGTS